MIVYRPGGSDSDSDEFGYDDGNERIKTTVHNFNTNFEKHRVLFDAIKSGDAETIFDLWTPIYGNQSIDTPLHQGSTLLMYSCFFGNVEMVKILIERGADVNIQIDNSNPLLRACNCESAEAALAIVKILLEHSAIINVLDNMGYNPMMHAVSRGHVEIVKLLVNSVCLESTDTFGNTALYLAIETNNVEIFKILLVAGATFNVTNRIGQNPIEYAKSVNAEDILKLLPSDLDEEIIPSSYLYYIDYSDLAPSAFGINNVPHYFQEIEPILFGLKMEKFLFFFAKNNINLEEFLTINDEKLKDLGIILPYYRKKIHLGLFKYHSYPWKKKSVSKVSKDKSEDTYDLFIIMTSHLKHLVVAKSSIKYIATNELIKPIKIKEETIESVIKIVYELEDQMKKFKNSVKYLQTFNPLTPVYHIDLNYTKAKPKNKLWIYLSGTSILGILFFIIKTKNSIF